MTSCTFPRLWCKNNPKEHLLIRRHHSSFSLVTDMEKASSLSSSDKKSEPLSLERSIVISGKLSIQNAPRSPYFDIFVCLLTASITLFGSWRRRFLCVLAIINGIVVIIIMFSSAKESSSSDITREAERSFCEARRCEFHGNGVL